ncbi:MAG: hypothetical protein ACLSAF_22510 [Intestinimonas sp.]
MDGKVEDDFTPEDKYGYLWCLTNPHTNLCGCYEVSIKQIAHELGYNTDTVERLLKRLDGAHNVIRYNAPTKELLVLNWYRYNWSGSEKLDKPLLTEIRAVKCDDFREYLADRYNERDSVAVPYEYWSDPPPQEQGSPPPSGPKRKPPTGGTPRKKGAAQARPVWMGTAHRRGDGAPSQRPGGGRAIPLHYLRRRGCPDHRQQEQVEGLEPRHSEMQQGALGFGAGNGYPGPAAKRIPGGGAGSEGAPRAIRRGVMM